jgi:hypothetical protein
MSKTYGEAYIVHTMPDDIRYGSQEFKRAFAVFKSWQRMPMHSVAMWARRDDERGGYQRLYSTENYPTRLTSPF